MYCRRLRRQKMRCAGAPPAQSKSRIQVVIYSKLAERVGFEPTEDCSSAVFKTVALDHSAISPEMPTGISNNMVFQGDFSRTDTTGISYFTRDAVVCSGNVSAFRRNCKSGSRLLQMDSNRCPKRMMHIFCTETECDLGHKTGAVAFVELLNCNSAPS